VTEPVQVNEEVDEKVSQIRGISLFASLSHEDLLHLARRLRWRVLSEGEILFKEGDLGNTLSILIDGSVDIVKAIGTSEEHLLAIIQNKGDLLGEMSLFNPDGVRSASARSRSQGKMLELSRRDFDDLLSRYPSIAVELLRELSARLRNSENTTIRELQERNARLSQAYEELKAAQAQLIVKEKLEHELWMARRIQESILPKAVPVISGWRLDAIWKPARVVSGDFYDFIQFGKKRIGLLIGDVSGKGIPASLVMATTRSILRVAAKKNLAPGEVLYQVNGLLCNDMPANMFVTCFMGILDLSSGRLCFANAGHDLPLLTRGREVSELRATGMPLGLLPDMTYEEREVNVRKGDRVVFYSDGLAEAHNPQKEMFGFPRLRSIMAEYKCITPVTTYLLDALADFTGPDWEQEDDVTLLTVEREN
jgi:serine phosphatase RsbU (regulator of sigma subunit)